MWKVIKFGGSSLNLEGFENIFKIIQSYQSENISNKIVIILSAIQNTTDLLYEFINNYTVNNLEKINKIYHLTIFKKHDAKKLH